MKQTVVVIMLAMVALMAACQGGRTGLGTPKIPPQDRIALAVGEEQKGVWESNSVSVHYQYSLSKPAPEAPGTLELTGTVSTKWRPRLVKVHVYFLDQGGQVLNGSSLFVSGTASALREDSFTQSLQTPPAATAMGFRTIVKRSRGKR